MSATVIPFPTREPAPSLKELSEDEYHELVELVDQLVVIKLAYPRIEENKNIGWWRSFSPAERRRLIKRYGDPVKAWRAHKAHRLDRD